MNRKKSSPPRSLKFFILAAISAISLILFVGTLGTVSVLYEKMLATQAEKTSRGIVRQTFNSVAQFMRLGPSRQELMEFILATKAAQQDSPYTVEIFRGKNVEEQYGTIQQAGMDAQVAKVLAGGREGAMEAEGVTTRIFPLRAEKMCLHCHDNVAEQEVLGAVAVRQNMGKIVADMRMKYSTLFVVYGLLIFLSAVAVAAFMVGKINRTVNLFQKKVADINTVRDLGHLDLESIDFGFRELNEAFDNFGQLVRRMQHIAIDRDILEVQTKLAGKFVITSKLVQNHQGAIKELLHEIRNIFNIYALVAVTSPEDQISRMEIYWLGTPSTAAAAKLEELAKGELAHRHNGLFGKVSAIVHHVAEPDGFPSPLALDEATLHGKSLLLEVPRVSSMVALYGETGNLPEPLRQVVLDSILAPLLNLVVSVQAITKYTEDLEFYATRDPLTGAHNQRIFWELLKYETGRAERHQYQFSLMVLDLDKFKIINDHYGHAFGDEYLKAFTDVLRRTIRDGDFLARYGGDEFTVLLPETSQEQAWAVARRVCMEVEEMTLVAPDKSKVKATTSIGIATYPKNGEKAKDLFLIADNMMYKAKGAGRNTIGIPDAGETRELFQLASDKSIMVHHALEEGRILPYFQPIAATAGSQAPIHELLMRIVAGDGRHVPAQEFIEVAEEMHVIHKLDHLLIAKALAHLKEVDYQGMLFINISPTTLTNADFVAMVHRLVEEYGLEPRQIVFEITERETVRNFNLLEKFVHALKSQGFLFAIDDFGSGFSSFSYLRNIPVDFVKIEGEFIRNMHEGRADKAFVKSIVTLAKELGVATVAECVESSAIFAEVADCQIDYAQGYFIGAPRPTPAISPPPAQAALLHPATPKKRATHRVAVMQQ